MIARLPLVLALLLVVLSLAAWSTLGEPALLVNVFVAAALAVLLFRARPVPPTVPPDVPKAK